VSFGAVDTAGFPKDMYWLFRSQWTKDPMVHLLPMNWTDHEPGEPVRVWATPTSTPSSCSSTASRWACAASTTRRPSTGARTSRRPSWEVPFAPGKLVAVARRDGREVARDELDTAGAPAAIRLTPDKRRIAAGGRSLSYLTVAVVDADGVLVPDADDAISFDVRGAGRLVGLDNGREESAENYKASTREAFNGKALAIVQSGDRSGPITVSASAPGLAGARTTLSASGGHGSGRLAPRYVPKARHVRAAPAGATADASYSGRPDTLPAAMLDEPGHRLVELLPQGRDGAAASFSLAHAKEWVSVAWPAAQSVGTGRASFVVDATRALPADIP